jgi:hypothetical protein
MYRKLCLLMVVAACGGTQHGGDDDGATVDAAGEAPDSAVSPQVVEELLALTAGCGDQLGGLYATDSGETENIPVCGLIGGVYWTADFDIDCDGIETTVCNAQTDGAYQPQTSAQTSTGEFLDASTLPYVVIPLPSGRFTYADHDIDLGQVVAVIYDGQIQFGVFGDQGPDDIIGEASYRMAQLLGIDPDPSTGGTDGPVTFIAFPGDTGRVTIMEDHQEASDIGAVRAQELIDAN